jgi:hypothetical protein
MLKSPIIGAGVVLFVVVGVGYYYPQWLRDNEPAAVWLEGIALIAIFILELNEYIRQGRDRNEDHEEMLEQLRIMQQQATSASESFQLLKTQWQEERDRDLLRAATVLDDIRYEARKWKDITDHKWGTVASASAIVPQDSSVVLVQAARHSNQLQKEVRETFRLLTNSDSQIAQFYSVDIPSHRSDKLMMDAHSNLEQAESRLVRIIEVFQQMEVGRTDKVAIGVASDTR